MINYQIGAALAQTIVDAAKEVIRYDINFIGADGIVIASTAPERIGTFHEAGRQAFDSEQPVEVLAAEPFQGSRPGINYPIVVDGLRLGAIGITGDPEACRSSGFLLTKITEVLVREQMQTSIRQSADEVRSSATRMLIFGEGPAQSGASLQEALESLQVRLDEPVFVILLESEAAGSGQAFDPLLTWLLEATGAKLHAYLFPNRYAVIAEQNRYGRVLQLLSANRTDRPSIRVGLGDCRSWSEAEVSYRNAKTAMRYAAAHGLRYHEYGALHVDMLLDQLPVAVKRDFALQRLGVLSEEERMLLRAYFRHNVSLKDTAEALFLHKNTLQYRLDKIMAKTGLDPRHYQSSVELYIGLLLDERLEESDRNG
ncbi:CdaR family transcriptional regulator [Paenibacillus puerhi]|uniref:CdaR family transcriptional regulator n=1 Tax=Paenibacillus puerhi TaxID=2692622 RepID=UPI001359AF24|nr:sugar diacid recognition domain-containing protein [Paenibacillus puerhi]